MATGNQIGSPTNFPEGFSNGINIRGVPLLQAQQGQVLWVNNSAITNPNQHAGSDSARGSFRDPLATIGAAVARCVGGRGDIVMVGSGHYETVSSPTAWSFNTSGVAIIGLGAGSLRPTLSFDTATTSTIGVAAENFSIQNVLHVGNFLSVASAYTGVGCAFTGAIANNVLTASAVTGSIYIGATLHGTGVQPGTVVVSQQSGTTNGAGVYIVSGFTNVASAAMTSGCQELAIDNCEFRDTSSSLGFLSLFTPTSTANAADGLSFTRNTWWSQSTVSVTCAIVAAAGQARWNLADNIMVSPTTAVTEGPVLLAAGGNNMTFITIARNRLQRLGVSTTIPTGVSTSGTAWTGHAFDNYVGTGLSGSTGVWINTGTKLSFTNNYSMITRAADKSALINPAAV